MFASLLMLAGCALFSSGDQAPTAGSGTVELRVLARACDAPAAACRDTAAVDGLPDAVVWTAAGNPQPVRGSLTFGVAGPEPALQVLPAGSTLALANATDDRLSVQWNAVAAWDSAVLASQAGRVLHLPQAGEVQIVAGGELARVLVGGVGAVTDADGRAELPGLPAGPQKLRVSHARLGSRQVEVNVPAGDRVVVEVELRPDPPEAVADSQ